MSDRYDSRIAGFIGLLNGVKLADGFAITISSTCTLYSVAESEVHEDWRRHELVHQRQIRDYQNKRFGWLRFMTRYLYYNIKYSYRCNPFEIEARNG